MGTLEGFPYPPAVRLRRAKPGYAYATNMGTLEGFPRALPYPPALRRRREGRGRRTRGKGRGGAGPEALTKSVGKARLRLRD